MIYASSGVQSVSVTLPDGREHVHKRKKDQEGPFELDCADCAAVLLKGENYHSTLERNGQQFDWTPNRNLVPRTLEETSTEEEMQRQAFAFNAETYREFQEFLEFKRGNRPPQRAIRV